MRIVKYIAVAMAIFGGMTEANASGTDAITYTNNITSYSFNSGNPPTISLGNNETFTLSGLSSGQTATVQETGYIQGEIPLTPTYNGKTYIYTSLWSQGSSNSDLITTVPSKVSVDQSLAQFGGTYVKDTFVVSVSGLSNGTYQFYTGGSFLLSSFVQLGQNTPTVTSLSASPLSTVPLPAALPMFGAGLAGLGFVGRRGAKKAA